MRRADLAQRLLALGAPPSALTANDVGHVDVLEPHVQRGEVGETPHRGAIGGRDVDREGGLRIAAGPALGGSDDQAGGQALDVPLPGSRQRLVEVVDVEDHPSLG